MYFCRLLWHVTFHWPSEHPLAQSETVSRLDAFLPLQLFWLAPLPPNAGALCATRHSNLKMIYLRMPFCHLKHAALVTGLLSTETSGIKAGVECAVGTATLLARPQLCQKQTRGTTLTFFGQACCLLCLFALLFKLLLCLLCFLGSLQCVQSSLHASSGCDDIPSG